MAGPLYRARQFFQVVIARPPGPADVAEVRRILPSKAVPLFLSMPPADQRHSLAVLHALVAQGHRSPPLLQAALLHDVSKASMGLWARTAVILLNAVNKSLVPRLATPDQRRARYAFYLSVHHPELGAALAERARLDPRAVALIRRHQEPAPPASAAPTDMDRWRRALKSVDDEN